MAYAKYRSLITSLHKSVECPVCLEAVKPPFRLCIRGHAVCDTCISVVRPNCPLCEGTFTLNNPVCVRSILEVLPNFCRFSDNGCQEIVEPKDDHEKFCGYRKVNCWAPGCSEQIQIAQLMKHCNTKHPRVYVCKDNNELIVSKFNINSSVEQSTLIPVYFFNNWLYIFEESNVTENQYKISFISTPIGKLQHNYYARVSFEKDSFLYAYTLKATAKSSCKIFLQAEGNNGESRIYGNKDEDEDQKEDEDEEENRHEDDQYCMKIPLSELSRFVDDEGLTHKVFFFREQI